jgi:agmatinase
MDHLVNPLQNCATVVDCGDIPNTPFDKLEAIRELQRGWEAINVQGARNESLMDRVRTISIGGDHTISECNIAVSQAKY